ncbi:MAG: glycosyltransferase [Chitinispirillaceae bacterium]|nr:glycosyltransferase [Chitinispirillaceae bacterium]
MSDTDRQLSGVLTSIVIINYKVPEHLRETLRSVYQAEGCETAEIIVVDNASGDHSQQLITREFPHIKWIQLKRNIGFGKACNVGVQNACGKYLLLLNPDTMIARNTLSVAFSFMESHPEIGLMGPKILNPDGTLQASCKRGFPTPAVAFYHFSGLSRLFPKSKRFGRYNLTFMDADRSAEVDAVSGSFMYMPRALFKQLHGFDERFFLYGEDLDLCYRIRECGKSIWYHPETQIIHCKGKSSAKSHLRSRIAFYEAMILFSRKYRSVHRGFFPSWFVVIGILPLSIINILLSILRHFIALIIDLSIINIVLWSAISLRFSPEESPYHTIGIRYMLGVHSLLSASFIFMYAYNGIYVKRRASLANALLSGLLATSLFSAAIYFVKQFALSRIAFAGSSIIILFLLAGWREVAHQSRKRFFQRINSPDRIIVVGNGPLADRIIHTVENRRLGTITGIVWDNDTPRPGDYEGYPVLGQLDELSLLLPRYRVDILIIATRQPWYSNVIDVLSNVKVKNLTVRWVPHDLTMLPAERLPAEITLRDFSV